MVRTNIVGPLKIELRYHPPMITIYNKIDGRVVDYVDMGDIHEAKRAFELLINGLNEMIRALAVSIPSSDVKG